MLHSQEFPLHDKRFKPIKKRLPKLEDRRFTLLL